MIFHGGIFPVRRQLPFSPDLVQAIGVGGREIRRKRFRSGISPLRVRSDDSAAGQPGRSSRGERSRNFRVGGWFIGEDAGAKKKTSKCLVSKSGKKFPAPCYSPTVLPVVPSPLESLTVVFGKGTSVTTPLWAPEKNYKKLKQVDVEYSKE